MLSSPSPNQLPLPAQLLELPFSAPTKKGKNKQPKPCIPEEELPPSSSPSTNADGDGVGAVAERQLQLQQLLAKAKQPFTFDKNEDVKECGRWWATLPVDVLCPVSNFPIRLLPYPPFRWQVKDGASKTRIYLDGKLLALQMIIDEFNGQVTTVCGRKPMASDVQQLDDYIRRCKLGPFKIGFVRQLVEQVVTAGQEGHTTQAYQDLLLFVEMATREMKKIHGIQHSRLGKMMRNRRKSSYQ